MVHQLLAPPMLNKLVRGNGFQLGVAGHKGADGHFQIKLVVGDFRNFIEHQMGQRAEMGQPVAGLEHFGEIFVAFLKRVDQFLVFGAAALVAKGAMNAVRQLGVVDGFGQVIVSAQPQRFHR